MTGTGALYARKSYVRSQCNQFNAAEHALVPKKTKKVP